MNDPVKRLDGLDEATRILLMVKDVLFSIGEEQEAVQVFQLIERLDRKVATIVNEEFPKVFAMNFIGAMEGY